MNTLAGVIEELPLEFRARLWLDMEATDVSVDYGKNRLTVSGLSGEDIPHDIQIEHSQNGFIARVLNEHNWVDMTEESPDLLLFCVLDPRIIQQWIPSEEAHKSLSDLGWPNNIIAVNFSFKKLVETVFNMKVWEQLPEEFKEWLSEVDMRMVSFWIRSDFKIATMIQPDLSPGLPDLRLGFSY